MPKNNGAKEIRFTEHIVQTERELNYRFSPKLELFASVEKRDVRYTKMLKDVPDKLVDLS